VLPPLALDAPASRPLPLVPEPLEGMPLADMPLPTICPLALPDRPAAELVPALDSEPDETAPVLPEAPAIPAAALPEALAMPAEALPADAPDELPAEAEAPVVKPPPGSPPAELEQAMTANDKHVGSTGHFTAGSRGAGRRAQTRRSSFAGPASRLRSLPR
jgi:hypothetical protein